ncbi:MAG: CvpA family protein [Rikenellaceae bacterium]
MSVFDIIVLLLLLWEAINGYRHGFVEMMFYIASIFIAIYVAKSLSLSVVGWLEMTSAFADHIAYILIFISTIIIVIIVAKLASQIIEGAGFGVLNKIGGVAFGIMRGALILGFFFMVFEGINQRERFANRDTLESTIFYYPVLDAGEFMLPYLPIEKVKEVFNEFSIPKEEVKTEDDK